MVGSKPPIGDRIRFCPLLLLVFFFLWLPALVFAGGHFPPMWVQPSVPQARSNFAADSIASSLWHLDNIHAAQAQEISRGAGILVAVLDSGVDTDHPALSGHLRLDLGRNFGDPSDPGDIEDGIGHGTTMAGLILQVAPDAKIIPLKINKGSSHTFTNRALLDALGYLHQLVGQYPQLRVANLSIVVDDDDVTAEITAAIDALVADGVMMAVAAGNRGMLQVAFPANMAMTLGISAVDGEGNTAGFANQGEALVMTAPGVHIYGPTLQGDFAYMSGTSPATALVSGSLALLAATTADCNRVLWSLLAGCRDLNAPGHDQQSGFGSLDVGAAAREVVAADIYSLPATILMNVDDERMISFVPAEARVSVLADAPFMVMSQQGNHLTVRGLQPGDGFLNLEWQGVSRKVPVNVGVAGSSADSCRIEHFMYPRYNCQTIDEKLWGFYALQCLEVQTTDGYWWSSYWENGGYGVHCLLTWEGLRLVEGEEDQGFLFSSVSMAAITPGIYEMGLSFAAAAVSGNRSFFVNLYY